MTISWRWAGLSAALLVAFPCHAGPCAHQIDQTQSLIDAKLQARAAKGPTARESAGAKTDRQPTPNSIARAEEKLGDVSPEKVAAVKAAMARAHAADGAGDGAACAQALADAMRALGP
jgi:hypothetical protein